MRRPWENTTQRLLRKRESHIWGKVIDMVGSPQPGVEFVHVLDRGADNFEVFCHLHQQGVGSVVRAAQLHRSIIAANGEKQQLRSYIQSCPVAGTYQIKLRSRPKNKARTANLELRFASLQIPMPAHQSPYVKEVNPGAIAMSIVWAHEVNAPKGVEPLEWVLYTSLPVESFEDARTISDYYRKRWLIEEWHKAVKTGCSVTDRQLQTPERLEAMVGLMNVVAVRLLQLKSLARKNPERPAKEIVPIVLINLLALKRGYKKSAKENLTVGKFYRDLAKLGGFLGRKNDGEPGWITIWRGWDKLTLLLHGYKLAKEMQSTNS